MAQLDAGLLPQKIRGAFYPTCYEHWQSRRVLNLFEDPISDDINARGPPHMVRTIVQQADHFKVLCLQYHGEILSEDKVRTLASTFNLEAHHFRYRYKVLRGFFPTTKWLVSPQANKNNIVSRDMYVMFSYSDDPDSITPHGTLAVELPTWLPVIEDINREYQTLPVVFGDIKPLL